MSKFSLYIDLIKSFIDQSHNEKPIVLDVGCGDGTVTHYLCEAGVECYGCDVEFKKGPYFEGLLAKGRIKRIETGGLDRIAISEQNKKYFWPYPDNTFDIIASRAVVEHVTNLDEFASECARTLRIGGTATHYFPSKFSLIEPHCGVPFGGIFLNLSYYKLCCYFGFCFKFYRMDGLKAFQHIRASTSYRSFKEIKSIFRNNGLVYVGSDTKRLLSIGLPKFLKPLSEITPLVVFFEVCRSRVSIFEKCES